MDLLDSLQESNIDEDNNVLENHTKKNWSLKVVQLKPLVKSHSSLKSKVPAKPKRLSSKLSASFYTPSERPPAVTCTVSPTAAGSGGSLTPSNNKLSPWKPTGAANESEPSSAAASISEKRPSRSVRRSVPASHDYNVLVTPVSVRTVASNSKPTPSFVAPPPPTKPPPSLSEGTPTSSVTVTPSGSLSDLKEGVNSDTRRRGEAVTRDMEPRSEKTLDVSNNSLNLSNSASTEAMLKDLRKMNPTYNSDLSVNNTLTVEAASGPISPTSTKSLSSNKRCSTNYPMAGLSSPGSATSPGGDVARYTHSGRSSIDSGTSSGPPIAKHSGHFVVVAVDFGTTFSGYAFSFTQEPNSIHMMRKWEGGDPGLINQKTPTCLLLEPDGAFHSFGFSARDFYHDLDSGDARKWLYFDKFKMVLHYHAELNHDTMLTAANGEKFPAKKVFSYSLKFFKEHALRELSDQSGVRIMTDDVKWVITVPAIWKQPAKQFMREAAYEAGMASPSHPDQLVISLEPEAASIYCRRLRMTQLVPDVPPSMPPLTLERNRKLVDTPELVEDYVGDHISTGSAYMVVDCGGGTVDITVHELAGAGGKLRELYRASGGPYGSVGVDNAFEQLLCNIFGSDFISLFKTKRPAGYVDLMIAFESRKRSASPYKDMPLNVSLPFSFIDYYKKLKSKTVEYAIRKYGDPDIKWSAQGMLRLTQEAMRKLFMPTISKIKEAVDSVTVANKDKGIQYIFLVGGFAESPLLQMEIRKQFSSQLRVIIPQDVGLSILKGAVLFGQDPTIIHVRISRMTYGVGVLNRYVKGKHPKNKLIKRDKIEWCTDVFDKFVLTDQPVTLGDTVIRSYTPAKTGQKYSIINIYSSDLSVPQFITDLGVRKCGTLQLDLSKLKEKPARKRREIQARMEFGDTEIKVSAVDVSTGASVNANIDFLSK